MVSELDTTEQDKSVTLRPDPFTSRDSRCQSLVDLMVIIQQCMRKVAVTHTLTDTGNSAMLLVIVTAAHRFLMIV